MTKNIAAPPALPLLGHAHYLMMKEPHEMVSTLRGLMETYMLEGKCLKLWIGPELNVLIFDAADIKAVLSGFDHLDKASEYRTLEPWLNGGLLLSTGNKWQKRRKVVMPAFHFNILRQFVDIFEKNSRVLIENFENDIKAKSQNCLDPYKWLNLCTLDVICGMYSA